MPDEPRDPDPELLAASAALDGEGAALDDPSDAAIAFTADAMRLRRAVRIGEAPPMPDLTAAVLDDLAPEPLSDGRRPRWARIASIAAAFILGVAVAAVFLLDNDFETRPIAAASLETDARAALSSFPSLAADIAITEYGAHPDAPVRTYSGTLHFRAAEWMTLSLHETTELPPTWPTNDVEIVVDDDRAWRSRRLGCPVDAMPECLAAPNLDGISGRSPFSSGWAAPVELVVPVDAIRGARVEQTSESTITATTTVAAAGSLVSTTVDNGGFRLVHADDEIEIRLDAETFVLRGFTIRASGSIARTQWATTWGYDDAAGSDILTLELSATDSVPLDPVPPAIEFSDGGFTDRPVALMDEVGAIVPEGFAPHRAGVLVVPGAEDTEVATWADGRAHIQIRRSPRTADDRPTGEQRSSPNGVVIVDASRHEVTVLTAAHRIAVGGSVSLEQLVELAGSVPVTGLAPPSDVSRADFIEIDGLVLAVDMHAGAWLPPADRGDIIGVALRGTTGRFSPSVGELSWLERGTIVVVTGSSDLATLLEAAALVSVP